MTTLLENPIPIIFIGVIVEAMLGAAYFSTREKWLIWAMLVALVVVLGAVGLEYAVVTDRERVEATLYGVEAALEANDLDRVLGYLSSSAVLTRGRAISALHTVTITSAKIGNLKITINRLTSPPTAQAEFIGTVHYDSPIEAYAYRHYTGKFKIELRLEGGRWLITDPIQYRELAS